MSENRKCVNCRHNIRKENPSGNIECVCEITNEHIGYVKCFEGWCRHWAKDNKLFVCPDQTEEIEAKITDLENTKVAKYVELLWQKVYDECGIPKSLWDNYTADHILTDLYGIRQKTIEADKKERLWSDNIANLHNGNFGSFDKAETYLNYWKAQAEAGYPLAEENVRYFEEMVRKNEQK